MLNKLVSIIKTLKEINVGGMLWKSYTYHYDSLEIELLILAL